jgi:hypothetical protein
MIKPGKLAGVRTVRAKFRPGPLFLRGIVIGEKQDLGIGVIFRVGSTHDQQRCSRLAPAGEVEKIVVGTVTVKIVGPFRFIRSEKKDYASTGLARQRLAACPEIGVGLAVQGPCELAKQKTNQQHLSHSESLCW